ncbi:uncharacterized protein LOC103716408 [Phoenix dactylifera]|uniref:Uncharacterized protein LOC103716408 n=1 Tax=Phoenix dactylifera TaxID=42345 RepID=A0A8B7CMX0_PHODC|nr:uncharacterized protein LOC103716408 [Phoenix dactylifera]
MLVSFLLGFFLGVAALVVVEGLTVLWVIDRLRRKGAVVEPPEREVGRDVESERLPTYPCNKQGVLWVLEQEKVPKVNTDGSPTRGSKEQKYKKNIVEVFPAKKIAKIKDHVLILSDQDGSQATIELLDCTVVAVSASNLSSRKWAKRYPIKLESKDSVIYSGSKMCYLYADTSWEKESWCKALRLASCLDGGKWHWFLQLSEEFHNYVASLNAEYPSFLKPSALLCEATDKTSRIDGSSRVRLFLKKLAKKATTKTGVESKASSASASIRGERRIGDKFHPLNDASLTDGLLKSSLEDRSSSNSLQDSVQPPSPRSAYLGNKSLFPIFSDAVGDENFLSDEGTLCWNLLFSRLFFDAKKSVDIHNAIKTRIQRTLSNMRTPSYIGEVTCTGLSVGNIPPYIHKMRVLPMDLNEVWAMEVDIEYAGGVILDIETRLEVCEPELQKDIINTTLEPTSAGEVNSELLEGIEHYRDQLKFSNNIAARVDNRDEGDKVDGLKQSRSNSWTSSYVSRWKAILHSIADQVSQVPLSLAIRVASFRGTLRLHIKPPPSDQLWFGFTSMPEIDWNLESSVGDRKITNSHIALLIGNRFKAAIRETLVLPNCESLCIPWMLVEKDDWVPREVAPFIWINQEALDVRGLDLSNYQPEEAKTKLDGNNRSKAGPAFLDDKLEKEKNVIQAEQPPQEPISEFSSSHGGSLASVSDGQSSSDSINEELQMLLLRTNETQESCDQSRVESPTTSSSSAIVTTVEETIPLEEDAKPKKIGRRARMKEIGKRVGDKLEEKRRHLEEKSRHIVEKMRDNTRT